MAADNFLKIAGIEGESTDDKHKGWMEILSFSWGVSQMASASAVSSSGGPSAGRADFQDLSIVKTMDSASPLLFKACAKGDCIKEVTLELCRSGGDKLKYMEYKLTNAVISSVSIGGHGGGEPTESISLNYGKIEQTYTKQRRPDGSGGGNVPAGWELETNKPV
jgi:type VI secretion system Hcp family effector